MRDEQPLNTNSPMEVTEFAVKEVSAEQPSNAAFPIDSTESGMEMEVSEMQPPKV